MFNNRNIAHCIQIIAGQNGIVTKYESSVVIGPNISEISGDLRIFVRLHHSLVGVFNNDLFLVSALSLCACKNQSHGKVTNQHNLFDQGLDSIQGNRNIYFLPEVCFLKLPGNSVSIHSLTVSRLNS